MNSYYGRNAHHADDRPASEADTAIPKTLGQLAARDQNDGGPLTRPAFHATDFDAVRSGTNRHQRDFDAPILGASRSCIVTCNRTTLASPSHDETVTQQALSH